MSAISYTLSKEKKLIITENSDKDTLVFEFRFYFNNDLTLLISSNYSTPTVHLLLELA